MILKKEKKSLCIHFGLKTIQNGHKKNRIFTKPVFIKYFKNDYFQPPPKALYKVISALSCLYLLSTKASSAFKALSFAVITSR